jgi:hypothetical protein
VSTRESRRITHPHIGPGDDYKMTTANNKPPGASELTREKVNDILRDFCMSGVTSMTFPRESEAAGTLIALCEHYLSTTAVAPAVSQPVDMRDVKRALDLVVSARSQDRVLLEAENYLKRALAAPPERTAQPTGASEAELVSVPRVPTDSMIVAGQTCVNPYNLYSIWQAMIAAAPNQPNWRASLEALAKRIENLQRYERCPSTDVNAPKMQRWEGIYPGKGYVRADELNAVTNELRELIDKLAAQQKGE